MGIWNRNLVFAVAAGLAAGLATSSRADDTIIRFWIGSPGGSWSAPANWAPTGVPSNTSGVFYAANIDGVAADVLLDVDATVDRVGIGPASRLTITNGRTLSIACRPIPDRQTGIMPIRNRVEIAGAGAPTGIRAIGPGELVLAPDDLSRPGVLVMSDCAHNFIAGDGADQEIVVEPTLLITGAGRIGGGAVRIVNRGVIEATHPTGITIRSAGPADAINAGVLRASNGSTLTLDETTLDNTNGVLEAQAGSTVRLINGTTISGGTLAIQIGGPEPALHGSVRALGPYEASGALVITLAEGFEPEGVGPIRIISADSTSGSFANAPDTGTGLSPRLITPGAGFNVRYDHAAGVIELVNLTAPPCAFADLAPPFGALNIDDVGVFAAGFLASDQSRSDCDANGVLNVDDIECFVASFLTGCP